MFALPSLRHAAARLAVPKRLTAAISAAACGVGLLAFGSHGVTPAAAATASSNQLSNPSFESGLAPWGGTRLSRVSLGNAPAGKYVARALAYNSRVPATTAVDPGETVVTALPDEPVGGS